MADAGVIRNFLVSLGFSTDNSGLSQMQDAMKGVEWKAKALNGALLALATGAVVSVQKTASQLDKLYFSSQRIGASVTNINAYGNAIAQLGGNADAAVGTLESLADKINSSPGYESMLQGLGVDSRNANGEMRDRVELMKDLSGVLQKMPAYQANAYAQSLGIDQNTLMAMRDGKFMANMEKYQKIQKELGMNDDLARSGNEFMSEYRDLTMMTKTGFQVIVMQAGKALIPILKLLNQLIQSGVHAFSQLNPQIKEGAAVALRFAMLALMFGSFIKIFGIIFKFIPMLKTFIGLLKLFRITFLATPIGIILALGAALALLYDDYKTWKEGGKSLFDWSKWTGGIDTIIKKIKDFLAILNEVKDKTIEFIQKIINDPAGALKEVAEVVQEAALNTAQELNNTVSDYINPADNKDIGANQDKVASIADFGFSVVDKGLAFFGNKDAQNRVEQRERGEIGYQRRYSDVNLKDADTKNGDRKPTVNTDPVTLKPTVNTDPVTLKPVVDTDPVTLKPVVDTDPINQKNIRDVLTVIGDTAPVVRTITGLAKMTENMIKGAVGGASVTKTGSELKLSEQDIIDIMKVTSTEVVPSLKGEDFEKQAAGVIDTILNRAASGKFGGGIRDVINQRWAFSDINSNQKTAYGNVQNVPISKVSKRLEDFTRAYIEQRASGKESSVGKHISYANPYFSSENAKKQWVNEVEKQAKETGLVFGKGNAIHVHGTPNLDRHRMPKDFHVTTPESRNNQSITQSAVIPEAAPKIVVPEIKNLVPPTGNPHKSQVNSMQNTSAHNVTINQEFKTDMIINGASSPVDSANAVKRQQENSMAIAARNAKGVLV